MGALEPARCSYCASLLVFRAQVRNQSLASLEQKKGFAAEATIARSPALYWKRLQPYGSREVWSIAAHCPGCGRQWGTEQPECDRQEVEAAVAEQNEVAQTAAAVEEAVGWRQRVRERAQQEAGAFARMILSRLSAWQPFLRYVPAGEPSEAEWDVALIALIEPPNPAVREPLRAELRCGEVTLSWGDFWHVHVTRLPWAAPDDPAHLEEAVACLSRITNEKVSVVATYRGERVGSSGFVPVDLEPSPESLPFGWRRADRIVFRSWTGRFDRTIRSSAEARDENETRS